MSREMIVFSFTRAGTELNRRLCRILRQRGTDCRGYAAEKFAGDGIRPVAGEIRALIGENWSRCTFLFIGAVGIAVRYIAPFVKDKFTDSAVLAADEKGRYVIPLLSGHMGGAVRTADEIAELIGAEAVHTTATDIRGKFAVDVFAGRNGLSVTDRKKAKEISAAVLEGKKIALCAEYPGCRIEGKVPEELVLCSREKASGYPYTILVADEPGGGEKENTLLLRPRNVTAGIGCRRGIAPELLKKGLESILEKNGLRPDQLECAASIDLKKNEPALLALAEEYRIPFVTYPAEKLREIRSVTSSSAFVEQTTGVDNVCERAALLCCPGGELVCGKSIRDSMTAALVRRPVILKMIDEK